MLERDLGLEVWFSPYPLGLTTDETLTLFADCAERAERIRQRGAEVVFVTGAELSIMINGFLPGDSQADRLSGLLDQPDQDRLDLASPPSPRMLDDRNGDTCPDLPWEPKAAFHFLAGYYRG